MPAPASAPKYGTLVGATPALLAELLAALEAELAADVDAADADLAPLEEALATALATDDETLETAEDAAALAEAVLDMLMPELMDWAAARPAKRRVIEKRMLILVYCFKLEKGTLEGTWPRKEDGEEGIKFGDVRCVCGLRWR
jgi:hypothetical protein